MKWIDSMIILDKWKISVPGDTSVNRSPLAEGIHDLLRATGICCHDGLLRALRDSQRESAGGTTGKRGKLVSRGLNRVSPELAGLHFSNGCRIINLGARVGRKSLKTSNGLEILLVAKVRRAMMVVIHVSQRWVLRLRLAVGITHHRGGVAEKVLKLWRWRVADTLRLGGFDKTDVVLVQILLHQHLRFEVPVSPPCTQNERFQRSLTCACFLETSKQ